MRLPDIRALLDGHLAGRPTRANFRTGTLTVCTMVPMRSVPHRVVCLVGLDDGVFPRLGVVDGDDVLARDPMTGERDIRSEDRQLLLDAIGAATENLVITYTGANEYSGQPRPPAVPLAELLDTLDMTVERTTDKIREPRRRRTSVAALRRSQRHPGKAGAGRSVQLRPDRAAGGAGGHAASAASAQVHLGAAAAAAGRRRDPRRPRRLLQRPGEGLLPRAGVHAAAGRRRRRKTPCPSTSTRLEEWTVGDRMLGDILRGMDAGRGAAGRVAPRHAAAGPAGVAQGNRDPRSGRPAGRPRHCGTAGPTPAAYDVDIDLGSGRRLTGTVSPVYGDRLVSVTYSKLDGKHLLESWIPLLALIAHDPGRDWSAVCIGRPKTGRHPARGGAGAPARGRRQRCCASWWRSTTPGAGSRFRCPSRRPMPGRPPGTAVTIRCARRNTGGNPANDTPRRTQAPAHVRAWGKNTRLTELMQPPRPGEEYDGEDTRLGAYAARVWLPMLRAERKP